MKNNSTILRLIPSLSQKKESTYLACVNTILVKLFITCQREEGDGKVLFVNFMECSIDRPMAIYNSSTP